MTTADPAPQPRLDLRHGTQRVFAHLLVSNAVVFVINYTVWFAITFWVFLETRSVFATGMIAGIFVVATAATGIWFGSLVDNYRKRTVMQVSALVSAGVYAACLALYLLTPPEAFGDVTSWQLWVFIVALMLGVIAGNPRAIALPALVTLLVPEDRRDRANGLVGTVTGSSMLVTSVISGVLVASGGMLHVLLLALVVLTASVVHLARVPVPEPVPGESPPANPGGGAGPGDTPRDGSGDAAPGSGGGAGGVDLRGTWRLVRGVPGLVPLIAFSCFNNFIGGGFMALMDAYGLSLVSVQVWGLLWGGLSALMIVGGLLVARWGLGSRPVRLLLLVNVAAWTATMLFPLASSIVSLTVAMAVFMLLMPFAEAAEQTVLQRVVPYERQGRVFGFAQSVEQSAAPITAFLMGPLTQFVVVPFMSGDGAGAQAIGSWFGTGQARAIALVFVITGAAGLVVTLLALASPQYRRLSASYAAAQRSSSAGQGLVEASVGLAAGLPADVPVPEARR
ncbi:MFS transporter, DHA3 family, multidrug efflux protein [Quadrisphaera granulorum]|uniref:DHA3 family multidrug efflux protein-like MFS transporter n=1 Tax=Quadrisphaera granulorum TaxID=317664 RepID=A0A316A7V5_9ACTN|nr:MFS transporter [Quadrisphaera granulorum]PWJ53693.1 DHA3 family multidrug efflux protein-like MFS transporter [Quadrisphaera granulorum]SZE96737.1 MFS transporter, DHA3 family, multidrug efflux protein [Quadrisphaera granulorum]